MSLNQQKHYWAKMYCKGLMGIGNLPSIIVKQGRLASFGVGDGMVQRNTTVDCKICFRAVGSSVGINECDVLTPAGTFVVPPGCTCDAEKKINSLGLPCGGVTDWRFWRWDEDPTPYNGAAIISQSYSIDDPYAPPPDYYDDIESRASQLCTGCQAHKVKVDTCCETVKEHGTFPGTAPLTDGSYTWGDWEPSTSDICGGHPFVQRRRLFGCRPCSAVATLDKKTGIWWSLDTNQAVGTAGASEPYPGYGKSINDALNDWDPESGSPPPTGWKTTDAAGNPYAEDNPDTIPDESTHLGACYPGTLAWGGGPANYSGTDEPECTYYADGTSSCDPPKEPCADASGPDCDSAIPSLKFMSLQAPEYAKCAAIVAYKAQSALFNFTLSKTYKVKFKVISLSGIPAGTSSCSAPAAPANAIYLGHLVNYGFGWGWEGLLRSSACNSRYIYIGYDPEEVSWNMEKTQGTYQWQSNQMVLDPSIYTGMQGKGVSQSGYHPMHWEVPFPSQEQIKGMAQYRVPFMADADLQEKIQNQIINQHFTPAMKIAWKGQIVNEATANGTGGLNNISLSPSEATLNPIEIGKTGNMSFGGNSLVTLTLGELAAGFNKAAYQKIHGIRVPAGHTGDTVWSGGQATLPCPPSCCCGKANCIHCHVSWGQGTSFAQAEERGLSNPDKLVSGVNLTGRQVSAWQGQTGFSFNTATWQAQDWNNGQNSWRIVWTQ